MQENDIKVLGEDEANIITYSKATVITLSRLCKNKCAYCHFNKKDNLTVPYSTIKQIKQARANGFREALYVSGERPDTFSHIRALLDLWGFSSYLDYLYTICELGFLEGLIPVLEVGFLTPNELEKLAEVVAVVKIMFDVVDTALWNKVYPESPGKRIEIKLKSLEWASKLQIPISTGIMVGLGETLHFREKLLKEIARFHNEYGMIQEVVLQNFVPMPKTPLGRMSPPSKEVMIKTAQAALTILPSDIRVIVPLELNPDIEDFINLGIRDLGRIYDDSSKYYYPIQQVPFNEIEQRIENLGFKLQQRFPLDMNFIKNGRYSKKLGQIFEAYRYKIKKEEQEKLKDIK